MRPQADNAVIPGMPAVASSRGEGVLWRLDLLVGGQARAIVDRGDRGSVVHIASRPLLLSRLDVDGPAGDSALADVVASLP